MFDECGISCKKCGGNPCNYYTMSCDLEEHICAECRCKDIYFVYMLQCSDAQQSIYTGITNNLERRIKQHNSNKGAKFTRGRTPVVLLKSFACPDKSEALRLEYYIKQLSREEKIKFNGFS